MLGYLFLSGRAAAYWSDFRLSATRATPPIDTSDFVTGFLWLGAVAPLIFAAWEIGKEHTAARRLDLGIFVGLREVLRRAIGRESAATVAAREETFTLPPRDRPVVALLFGAAVAVVVPTFFASFSADLRTPRALIWLIGAGILMGLGVYCRQRAMVYLRDEPGRWDFFGQWRLLNPERYDTPGKVFVRWQIAATVAMPFWWLGGGMIVMSRS
jgi:hypothetical protein